MQYDKVYIYIYIYTHTVLQNWVSKLKYQFVSRSSLFGAFGIMDKTYFIVNSLTVSKGSMSFTKSSFTSRQAPMWWINLLFLNNIRQNKQDYIFIFLDFWLIVTILKNRFFSMIKKNIYIVLHLVSTIIEAASSRSLDWWSVL